MESAACLIVFRRAVIGSRPKRPPQKILTPARACSLSLFLLYTHHGTVYCGIFAFHFPREDTLLCVGEHECVRRSWIYGGPRLCAGPMKDAPYRRPLHPLLFV